MDKKQFLTPETFLDGTVDIWALSDIGYPTTLYSNLHFQRRIVGSKRAYDAMFAGHTVQMVIWVPLPSLPENTELYAVLRGTQFHVLQMQILPDKFPRLCQLTLEHSDMRWERNQEITLIRYDYRQDSLLQQIPAESRTTAICTVRHSRLLPKESGGVYRMYESISAVVPAAAYSGETSVIYKDTVYSVSEVYSSRDDVVELSLEEHMNGGSIDVSFR